MTGTVSLQILLFCIINNNVVIRMKLLLQCRMHFTGLSDKLFKDFYIKKLISKTEHQFNTLV